MSEDALAALASDNWADVCRGLDMLVAMRDQQLWARLAKGVSYIDGKVSFAKKAEIASIMGPPRLKAKSAGDSNTVQRIGPVVVGLHALFKGDVSDVRKLVFDMDDDVDDIRPLLRLPTLEELEMSGDDVDIEPLGQLTNLTDLALRRFTGLSDEPGLAFIRGLPSLRSLYIDLGRGTGSPSPLGGLEALQDHQTLHNLALDWCDVGEEDLQIIVSIPHLESLQLGYADYLEDYRPLRSAFTLKRLSLDIGGRSYGGLACLAHLFERDGLELTDDVPAGVTTAVDLSAFQSLSPAAVDELNLCDQTVVLNGLTFVSSETVKTLTANSRNLYFDGLESMDMSLARILSRHTGYLSLRGVKKLDDDAAALMAERAAWFCMALPSAVNSEIQKAIRENPWYIPPDACHWPIAPPGGDVSPECRVDDADATVLTAEQTLKVRSLLESSEENGVSLALALMAHVRPEGWHHVFDSAALGRVAETWKPEIWRQFCDFCSSSDVLQAFIVAVARRLAAKSLEVDEPSEHVELLGTLDCEETPVFLRSILRQQVPAVEESEYDDLESDDDDEGDDSEASEIAMAGNQRTRPWFL